MKIERLQSQLLNNSIYKLNEKNKVGNEIKNKSSVNIEISNSAKELVQKLSQSNDTGFSEKVEKIRQSIIDGNYKVNSEDIADKIIRALENQKGSVE